MFQKGQEDILTQSEGSYSYRNSYGVPGYIQQMMNQMSNFH